MSELKVYHHELRHNEYEEFYLKYEADKVIADLRAQIVQADAECANALKESKELKADYKEACGRLQTANLIKDEQLAATRHQKYKRCLAMASYWVTVSFQCVDDKHRQRAERRHRKWLKLAEKFKEAK